MQNIVTRICSSQQSVSDISLHFCLVFSLYSKYSKVDLAKAIDLELKGDIENCLIAVGKAHFKTLQYNKHSNFCEVQSMARIV